VYNSASVYPWLRKYSIELRKPICHPEKPMPLSEFPWMKITGLFEIMSESDCFPPKLAHAGSISERKKL